MRRHIVPIREHRQQDHAWEGPVRLFCGRVPEGSVRHDASTRLRAGHRVREAMSSSGRTFDQAPSWATSGRPTGLSLRPAPVILCVQRLRGKGFWRGVRAEGSSGRSSWPEARCVCVSAALLGLRGSRSLCQVHEHRIGCEGPVRSVGPASLDPPHPVQRRCGAAPRGVLA